MNDPDAIVIGAGPAGLACAACLQRAGIEALILEKGQRVGTAWRHHYDRLRLHTDKGHSGLPGLPMPRDFPKYPERAKVVRYLENYADHFRLDPRFSTEVVHARRADGHWQVETTEGTFGTPNLIIATGFADRPFRPSWPGEERFGGDIRHSSAYRNPQPYIGKHVLVVGFGNSGGEIALDLAEHGIAVSIAVRGPVNIIPRDVLGIPILSLAIPLRLLPPAVADVLSAPIRRLSIGSLNRLSLRQGPAGPLVAIRDNGRIPLIDVGTVAKIRQGAIDIRPGLHALDTGMVAFEDGRSEPYDAIILATGFRPDLRPLLRDAADTLDSAGMPKKSGMRAAPGLFFCGFFISPTGLLREIGIEARRIARQITDSRQHV